MHTHFFSLYAVRYPIRILLKIFISSMPVLYIQVSTFIVHFEIIPIIRQVLSTGKPIKPHQRVHIKSAYCRFVFRDLSHQIHITIQFQTIIEYHRSFPKCNIMLG